MGWQALVSVITQNLIAGNTIVDSTGLYVYNGTPANGNLIASLANAPGASGTVHDRFGNVVFAGITAYGGIDAVNLDGNTLSWYTSAGVQNESIQFNTALGGLIFSTIFSWAVVIQQALQVTGPITATGGTPANPTVIETDTWQTLGIISGSNCTINQARYRLTPQNEVEIDISLTANTGGTTAGTYTWSVTLPAQYTPLGAFLRVYQMGFNAQITTATQNCIVAIDGKTFSVPGRVRTTIPALAAAVNLSCTQIIPLD
jgi:hypothetical protein